MTLSPLTMACLFIAAGVGFAGVFLELGHLILRITKRVRLDPETPKRRWKVDFTMPDGYQRCCVVEDEEALRLIRLINHEHDPNAPKK